MKISKFSPRFHLWETWLVVDREVLPGRTVNVWANGLLRMVRVLAAGLIENHQAFTKVEVGVYGVL